MRHEEVTIRVYECRKMRLEKVETRERDGRNEELNEFRKGNVSTSKLAHTEFNKAVRKEQKGNKRAVTL